MEDQEFTSDRNLMKQKCIEKIEAIYKAGKDVQIPVPRDMNLKPITILVSHIGYKLQVEGCPPEPCDDVNDVVNKLLKIEDVYMNQEYPLWSLYVN
ncbi:MAG: hypothetical protein KKB20_16550 [Proteobacteria bacterium]|nr:hypothetical protein [Pseudomonadota bacterium]